MSSPGLEENVLELDNVILDSNNSKINQENKLESHAIDSEIINNNPPVIATDTVQATTADAAIDQKPATNDRDWNRFIGII